MDQHGGARAGGQGDQVLLLLGAVLMFVGAQLHPRASLDLSFRQVEESTLSSPAWVPDHALILGCLVVLTAGLVAMLRRGRLHGAPRNFAAVMLAGTLLLLPEMVVHILMNSEADAVGAGGSTPLFDAHVLLQAVATPVFGVGVVGLAATAGWRRLWGGRVTMLLGVVGGAAFGLSGPLVALHPAAEDMLFFIGLVPLAVWLVLATAGVLWRERQARRAPERPVPADSR